MSKAREYNMDCLRIVCCFLIVLLHFSSSYRSCVPIGSYSFNVMTVYNCITRVAVPLFIMLSGYFLLDKEYSFEWKSYIKRPAKLLLTFYIWSAFYAFQDLIIELIKTGAASKERLEYTRNEFIFGHYHMWFCFLIIGYYLLFPIAKKIAEDFRVLTLFIVLWIVFAFVVPCLFSWLDLPTFSRYFGSFEMNAVRGYWGYFFLGYYIKRCNWTGLKKLIIYLCGLLSLGLTIYLTIHQSLSENAYVETWFSTGSPFVLCMTVAVFTLFHALTFIPGTRAKRIIKSVSECTFFIYMFHIFILEKLNLVGITTVSMNALISVPLLTIAAFASSLLIAEIVKRIPVIGKLLLYK